MDHALESLLEELSRARVAYERARDDGTDTLAIIAGRQRLHDLPMAAMRAQR